MLVLYFVQFGDFLLSGAARISWLGFSILGLWFIGSLETHWCPDRRLEVRDWLDNCCCFLRSGGIHLQISLPWRLTGRPGSLWRQPTQEPQEVSDLKRQERKEKIKPAVNSGKVGVRKRCQGSKEEWLGKWKDEERNRLGGIPVWAVAFGGLQHKGKNQ